MLKGEQSIDWKIQAGVSGEILNKQMPANLQLEN
jgi:hypothetical protein